MKAEMFTVLDENGIPDGKTISRNEVHQKGLWHECIIVCVIDKNNKLLIQKRAKGKSHAGLWDLTIAGHMSAGEFPMDALFKESMEEVGVILPRDLKVSDLKHLKTFRDSRAVREDFIENQFVNLYVIHKDVNLKDIVLKLDEVEEVKKVSIYEMKEMAERGETHPRTQWVDIVYNYLARSAFR
ncbi:MAG: NUDIX domain-containing protein [Firmicutes bacterium]|nr:NUDIX domain-containing protein [Bacillota bacterium]